MLGLGDGPSLFYLFREDDDIKIREMTDAEADKIHSEGQRWLVMPKRTWSEAHALRMELLKTLI
jgi:hypothetical protein